MKKIALVLITSFMLFNVACSSWKFWQKPQQEVYVGVLNLVKEKKEKHYWLNPFVSDDVIYELQLTIPRGIIISGTYYGKKGWLKTGDFVSITIEENRIIKVKKLDRSILFSNFR